MKNAFVGIAILALVIMALVFFPGLVIIFGIIASAIVAWDIFFGDGGSGGNRNDNPGDGGGE